MAEDMNNSKSEHFNNWKKGTIPAYEIPKVADVAKTEINFIILFIFTPCFKL